MSFHQSSPFAAIKAKAFAAYETRNYDFCETLVGEGLALEPENLDLLALGGQVKRVKEEYDLARLGARRMIELAPDDDRGYSLLAWNTLLDDSYCPFDPNVDPKLDDGTAAWRLRLEIADSLNQRCLEMDPVDSDHWLLKAKICYLRDQYDEAIEASETGLRFSPSHSGLHHYRILAFGKQENTTAMHAALLEQLRRRPEDDWSHNKLSQYYLLQKQVPKAIEHAREAVRLDPNDEENREVYWDAVMASNPIIRPFIQLRSVARQVMKAPGWVLVAAVIILAIFWVACSITLDALLQEPWSDLAKFSVALFLATAAVAVSSDRPFMAVFDLYYWFRNPTYRVSQSIEKRNENLAIVAIPVVLLAVNVSIAMKVFWPVALMILAMPAACIFYSNTWKLRGFTVAMMILAIVLLWFGLDAFHNSQTRSPQRTRAVQLLMGFFITCVVTSVITGIAVKNASSVR